MKGNDIKWLVSSSIGLIALCILFFNSIILMHISKNTKIDNFENKLTKVEKKRHNEKLQRMKESQDFVAWVYATNGKIKIIYSGKKMIYTNGELKLVELNTNTKDIICDSICVQYQPNRDAFSFVARYEKTNVMPYESELEILGVFRKSDDENVWWDGETY